MQFLCKKGIANHQTISSGFSVEAPREKISREIFFWEAFP